MVAILDLPCPSVCDSITFQTLFSGIERPRRLKLGTHMDSGQMCIPESGCCCLKAHTFILFSFSPIFKQNLLSHFSQELWGLEGWTFVDSGPMYLVYWNQAAAAYSSLYFTFFLSNFQTLKYFVTLVSGTVRSKRLKLCGQWTDVSCIPESGCCCLFVPLFLHFSFSPIFKH